MNAKQVVDYICEVLNINTNSTLIILDMVEDLKSIDNLPEFKNYIKSRIANLNDDYRYLSGYQKFIKCIDDFKAKEKQQIILDNPKINSFSEDLFKKTCDVFEEINWLIQNGNDIESDKVKKFIYIKFVDNPKEIEVLKLIGDKSELLNLVKHSKNSLHEKIKKVVINLTIKKNTNTQIEYKDKEVMKKLQKQLKKMKE